MLCAAMIVAFALFELSPGWPGATYLWLVLAAAGLAQVWVLREVGGNTKERILVWCALALLGIGLYQAPPTSGPLNTVTDTVFLGAYLCGPFFMCAHMYRRLRALAPTRASTQGA